MVTSLNTVIVGLDRKLEEISDQGIIVVAILQKRIGNKLVNIQVFILVPSGVPMIQTDTLI